MKRSQMSRRRDLADYTNPRRQRALAVEYWFARLVEPSGGFKLDGSWDNGDVFDGERYLEVKTVDFAHFRYVNCGAERGQPPHLPIVVLVCLPEPRVLGQVDPKRAIWGRPFVNNVHWEPCWYVETAWIEPYEPPHLRGGWNDLL